MKILDEYLTLHFRLSEFVRSQTAERKGIDNTPPPEIIKRLRLNAEKMELVRAELDDNAISISSGYRCLELNRAIGSKDTSAHARGDATDFDCPGYGSPLQICQKLEASTIPFDQLIWEHTWTHIGWASGGRSHRQQVLTLLPGGRYALGLVES